jgi:flavin-dependent dehydrogenase
MTLSPSGQSSPRQLTIVGGGLAGLGLANGLARAGLPVELHEAGHYPRHRVCGEFLAGLKAETVHALGLGEAIEDALPHRHTAWVDCSGSVLSRYVLPEVAPGISRYQLDHRMARLARERGAVIHEGSRLKTPPGQGLVHACGSRPSKGGRIGLKAHFSEVPLMADLEIHLGRTAYVGLSPVEDGFVNACGIFRNVARGSFASPVQRFLATIREHGLEPLARRLEEASFREGSFCSVTGLRYGSGPHPAGLALGDHHRMIPPFTGHGMTLALEMAAIALPHLVAYSREEVSWESCLATCRRKLKGSLAGRCRTADFLHPFLLHPPSRKLLAFMAGSRLLPFKTLYRLTHG